MMNHTKKLIPLSLKMSPPTRTRRRWVRWLRRIGIGFGALAVIVLGLTAVYYSRGKTILDRAHHAQGLANRIPVAISAQKFSIAHRDVKALHEDLESMDATLARMKGLSWWPIIGTQYRAGVELVRVGIDGSVALDAIVSFADNVISPLAAKGKVNMASISDEERGVLLKGMSEQETVLQKARQAVRHGNAALAKVPDHGLLPPLQRVVGPLKQQYPAIMHAVDQAIPAARIIPAILGYPAEKKYLFLLENNAELRPGGGFIGTYGLLRIKNGGIISLRTDNSYNLDERAAGMAKVTPPEPLIKYNRASRWYFRDANWSPDFPTSAKQALTLYQREGGEKNVDGVWAMTPTMISKLIGLVGPITVEKTEFTEDNLAEKLQYIVDQGFKYTGKNESQRKDIIGVLTKELVDRILKLPLSQWKDLFLVLSDQLEAKQFLLFMQDTAVQSVLTEENWAGAIQSADAADSILIADANIGALKTDPAVERRYTYAVDMSQDRPVATLTIQYHHTGKFGWKTTRYRTYTRVYVPAGSELIEAKGAMKQDRSTAVGEVLVSTELGKTVFGAFKSIEPQTDGELIYRYRLPANIKEAFKKKSYRLLWQKEAGLLGATVKFSINPVDGKPKAADGLDNQAHFGKNTVSFSGSLNKDRDVLIRL